MEFSWLWTTAAGLACVVVAAYVVLSDKLKFGISPGVKKGAKLVGIVAGLALIANLAGVGLTASTAPAATSVGSFEVTAAESSSWLTLDQNAKKVICACDYNTTASDFDDNTDYIEVTFTVQRGLGNIGLTQTYGDVSSIPSVSSSSGDAYPIITKTNELYDADWEREDSSTANKMVTITIAEDDDGVDVILNITLNGDAVSELDQYDTVDIGVTIGGESWTIQVLLATVST